MHPTIGAKPDETRNERNAKFSGVKTMLCGWEDKWSGSHYLEIVLQTLQLVANFPLFVSQLQVCAFFHEFETKCHATRWE